MAATLAWIFLLHQWIDLVVLGGVALSALFRTVRKRRPDADAHAALPTLATRTDALPVTLTIFGEKGRTIGKKTGWVTFAEGWLVYEGLRTAFSLDGGSIVRPTYLPHGIALELRDGRLLDLAVLTDPEKTHLPARRGDIPLLAEEIRHWLRRPLAPGEAILPPRQEHPEVTANRVTLPALVTLFTLLVGSGAALGGDFQLNAIFLPVGIACFIWLAIGLWRFGRDLPMRME